MSDSLKSLLVPLAVLTALVSGCAKQEETGRALPFQNQSNPAPFAMSPSQAASYSKVFLINLYDIDDKSGTAGLSFSFVPAEEKRVAGPNQPTPVLTPMPQVTKQKAVETPRPLLIDLRMGRLMSDPKGPKAGTQPKSLATEARMPSPSGRFILDFKQGPPKSLRLLDRKGRKLEEIPDAGMIIHADWSTTDDYFTFSRMSSSGTGGIDERLFSTKSLTEKPFPKSKQGDSNWSSDARILCSVDPKKPTPKNLPTKGNWEYAGTIVVYDTNSGFKPVSRIGSLAIQPVISPSGKMVAYLEAVKDEYGDYGMVALRVADIPGGKTRTLLLDRRDPVMKWADDDHLMVVTHDKHDVPILEMVSVGGQRVKLAADRNVGMINTVAYLPKYRLVVYTTSSTIGSAYNYEFEELWSVRPGEKPVHLFPKTGGTK